MARFWLVGVETAHIQGYIFSSNRLKENIGASYLVAAATDLWAREAVDAVTKSHSFGKHGAIEAVSTLEAEIIYAGGGNFVCLFRTEQLAKDFLGKLSRKALFEAPGLHIVGHIVGFEWGTDALGQVIREKLHAGLKEQRTRQPLSRGLLGLGVTAMCDSTSQPAVAPLVNQDNEHRVYAAEAIAKQVYVAHANHQLAQELDLKPHFRYPLDFDDLGRTKGEKSYIAVVHADGNGMGVLVQELANQFKEANQNRKYIEAMRTFSQKIKDATQAAVRETMRILQTQPYDDDGILYDILSDQAPLKLTYDDQRRKWILPFRPLISGGDDVTFVCDGRIGLPLTAIYLREFETATKTVFADEKNEVLKRGLTACAGVAIVKAHYPFARAYDLAEELCQSAKVLVQGKGVSGMDWHFTAGGLYADLDTIREREYDVKAGRLTLRPVMMGQADEAHSWRIIERLVTEFQQKWSGNRSKAKGLMDVLRQGPEAVAAYETRYLRPDRLDLPQMPTPDSRNGWHKEDHINDDGKKEEIKYCDYYDALELMDLYVTLRTSQEVTRG